MRWAAPLAGLVALGVIGPLLAHLLSRRPPTPLPFPSLQFLRATPTSARRLRTLHDRSLWALRTLIVLIVAGAAAGPTLVTRQREAAWRAPVLRALVTGPNVDARALDDQVTPGWRYDRAAVRDSLAAAVRDLQARTDVPRVLVVRWDGRVRSLEPADFEAVPREIGLQLEITAPALPAPDQAGAVEILAAPEDDAARQAVLASAPWGAAAPPLVVWSGAQTRAEVEVTAVAASRPVREVFRRMRLDPRLRDAAYRSRRDPRTTADDLRLDRRRFEILAHGADGEVLLWGAMAGSRPLLVLDARVRDPLALWSLRSAADAARSMAGWPRPNRHWTEAERLAQNREPMAPPSRLPGGLDTRWWWGAALTLVVVEGRVRRRAAQVSVEHDGGTEARDAA